jgi:hypothetical protein
MNWNDYFAYNDGKLYWKISRGASKISKEAGWVMQTTGYRGVKIKGQLYMTHRVIYELLKGVIPVGFNIDHIDGNKLNNKIENLRLASTQENSFNRGKQSNNTSGYKGVFWDKTNQKWKAQTRQKGRTKSLGYFKTPEEASKVYESYTKILHGEFFKKE